MININLLPSSSSLTLFTTDGGPNIVTWHEFNDISMKNKKKNIFVLNIFFKN